MMTEDRHQAQPDAGGDSFDTHLRDETPKRIRDEMATSVTPGDTSKELTRSLSQLSDDELRRLAIIDPGTPLPQGSVFLDLNDIAAGPFKAIGGQEAEKGQKLIAKSETDYELWNRLAARDVQPDIERPDAE